MGEPAPVGEGAGAAGEGLAWVSGGAGAGGGGGEGWTVAGAASSLVFGSDAAPGRAVRASCGSAIAK